MGKALRKATEHMCESSEACRFAEEVEDVVAFVELEEGSAGLPQVGEEVFRLGQCWGC